MIQHDIQGGKAMPVECNKEQVTCDHTDISFTLQSLCLLSCGAQTHAVGYVPTSILIHTHPSAHLIRGANAHTTTTWASPLSGPPGAWMLVTSSCVRSHTTASAQPVSLLSMLSREEGRGAGMQLHPTLMERWAQLELEAKKLELEVRKFSGFYIWGIRESGTQGTKILEQALAASHKRFN